MRPSEGKYTLFVVGKGMGTYDLEILLAGCRDKCYDLRKNLTGISVLPGKTHTYHFNYPKTIAEITIDIDEIDPNSQEPKRRLRKIKKTAPIRQKPAQR